MIIAATGHRPKSLPTGYNLKPLIALAGQWLDENQPGLVVTGGALGWDQAVAIATIERGLNHHCYIPFPGQADKWPTAAHATYQRILSGSQKIVTVSPEYDPGAFQRRNEAMVDACDMLLALWSGDPGGTANCLLYADVMGVPHENVWDRYIVENQEDEFEV